MSWYWVNTTFCCCGVAVDTAGVIRIAAPILRKFVGQDFAKLQRWSRVKEIRAL